MLIIPGYVPGHNWRLTDRPDLGAMNIVNRVIRDFENKNSKALPDLRKDSTIFIGSDYSGQHSTSKYEAFSFVFTNLEQCESWFIARSHLRARLLPDGRRFSYKALGDYKKSKALFAFLETIDLIPGLIAVFLVEKTISSIFKSDDGINSKDSGIHLLSDWAPHIAERLLRICHFVAFFLAGLSRDYQDVLWITDQDDIVANTDKHTKMVEIFKRVSSHYLTHDLKHIRIATTASDTGNRDIEDFVAISDIAAGTVCEIFNNYYRSGSFPQQNFVSKPPEDVNQKAKKLMDWFSNNSSPLKRLVIAFETQPNNPRLYVRQYKFIGSREIKSELP